MTDVECPFCKETGFDLIGLKIHYIRFWCDEYNKTPVEHEFAIPILKEAENEA